MSSPHQPYFKFTTVPNVFATFGPQCAADPTLKISTQPSLGLLERTYDTDGEKDMREKTQWERFARWVEWLNENAEEGTCYKVLYLTRHGVGFHNVQNRKVGDEAWDNHWSRLEGDGDVVWADAHLVPEGIEQAEELGRFWSHLRAQGAPLPNLYTSPLTRCLQTTTLVFSQLYPPPSFNPLIKELLREQMTDHTCDRRSSLTYIKTNFPAFRIEQGFTENDELWRADHWETMEDHAARKYKVLSEIFDADKGMCIGLTVHSFAIAVILIVLGAEVYRVREGTSIAVLVKAERVEEKPVTETGKLVGY